MTILTGLLKLMKEVLRHLLRRPVVGLTVLATDSGSRILLIRRADSGKWALPGGTVEWGETLRETARRELLEEAGATVTSLDTLAGVYSDPNRDPRFHAVTVVVRATVEDTLRGPDNPIEVREARFFAPSDLPAEMSHGTGDMLRNALQGGTIWE